jgi:radical SAM superfamily enzyme YgiQ (UPF0313 family)
VECGFSPRATSKGEGAAVKVLLIDPPFYRLIGFYNRYLPIGLVSVGKSLRDGNAIRHNPPRERIRDLDALAPPDRTLMTNKALYSPEDMGLIMTRRGCLFSCTFCAADSRQVRYRSIGHVLGEIRHVRDTYGAVHFTLKDDSFTVNEKRGTGWQCNARGPGDRGHAQDNETGRPQQREGGNRVRRRLGSSGRWTSTGPGIS